MDKRGFKVLLLTAAFLAGPGLLALPAAAMGNGGGTVASVAQAAPSAGAKRIAPPVEVPAGADGKTVFSTYLEAVRNIYRETARMLGAAQGDERHALITLQNHCSRSLGRLREMLNQAELKPVPNGATVVGNARQIYEECKTRYEGHRAG
ncbi:MAG: hypothetical protein JNK11_03470 [Alphaproteobacteria bacterium]|nr:hypothetical protein [Alphaproteobacteria bacterium]